VTEQSKIAKQLREKQGFDKTTVDQKDGRVRVACSQCEATITSGVASHESGCPHIRRSLFGN
jgi:hypothetical protein